jgi:hypothetical protein
MGDIKRARFFDQQLLVLKDFTEEQAYHIEMRRRHNQQLHTPGIASGLVVTKSGLKKVEVSPGMAIDREGRELVLDAKTEFDLSNATIFPPGSSILVVISYNEESIEPYASDPTQMTRTKEAGRPGVVRETTTSQPDPSAVQLARVILNNQGEVSETIDTSVRRLAGASAFDKPDADLTVRTLRISSAAIPIAQWPSLSVTGANQMTLNGSLGVQSLGVSQDITINGNLKAVGDISSRNLSLTGSISGKLDCRGPLLANTLQITDANGAIHQDNVIGMAKNIEGTTKWLQIGGITDAGERRLALLATVAHLNGNLGIGTTKPKAPLSVQGPNDPLLFLNHTGTTGNTAIWLAQDGVEKGFVWWDRAGNRLNLGTAGANPALSVENNGNVGIGLTTAGFRLDVNGRIRLREGGDVTAGLWLMHNNSDRAFVGLTGPDEVGFWGNAGVGWGLRMNVQNGTIGIKSASINLGIQGNGGGQLVITNNANDNKIFLEAFSADGNGHAAEFLLTGRHAQPVPLLSLIATTTRVTGNLVVSGGIVGGGLKGGFVTDQFINKLGEAVEDGDVIVVGANQSSLYYGERNHIPIPEADLTDQPYDTSVCGIVCQTYGELKSDSSEEQSGKTVKGSRKKALLTPQPFSPEEMAKQDLTKVEPGQIGWMVTLGAYANCKVDADIAPIQVGDLLTTSTTKGHAQKVLDPSMATGAIIGKALGALKKGKGKIPVLVTLH